MSAYEVAVRFAAIARTVVAGHADRAIGRDEALRSRRRVIRPLVPVLIARAGAVQAGIAELGAVGLPEEAPPDSGDVSLRIEVISAIPSAGLVSGAPSLKSRPCAHS